MINLLLTDFFMHMKDRKRRRLCSKKFAISFIAKSEWNTESFRMLPSWLLTYTVAFMKEEAGWSYHTSTAEHKLRSKSYRRQTSPSLSYVTESGEGNGKDGRWVEGTIWFSPYALPLGRFPLLPLTATGWPAHVCIYNCQRSSDMFCYIRFCTYRCHCALTL
jgi:hypothetical protein